MYYLLVTDTSIFISPPSGKGQRVFKRTPASLELVKEYKLALQREPLSYMDKLKLGEALLKALSPINRAIDMANGRIKYNKDTGDMWITEVPDIKLPELMAKRLMDFMDNGFPIEALIKFWVKLSNNPDKKVREFLYKFLENKGHPITEEGDILTYKAVYRVSPTSFNERIVHRGLSYKDIKKIVNCHTQEKVPPKSDTNFIQLKNGKWVKIPNAIEGESFTWQELLNELNTQRYTDIHSRTMDIKLFEYCEMDRTKCNNNPQEGCAAGLHVGNMEYVQNYGRSLHDSEKVILACIVNPTDVVSVPIDSGYQKMRCSKYLPIKEIEEEEVEAYLDVQMKYLLEEEEEEFKNTTEIETNYKDTHQEEEEENDDEDDDYGYGDEDNEEDEDDYDGENYWGEDDEDEN